MAPLSGHRFGDIVTGHDNKGWLFELSRTGAPGLGGVALVLVVFTAWEKPRNGQDQ